MMDTTEIELPLDIIQRSYGLSLDIGGSVAKLIYRSKEDYKDGKPITPKDGQKTGKVRLKLFARDVEEIENLIKYIKVNVDLTKHDGKTIINCTGIGANFYKLRLEHDLGISIQSRLEYDYFATSFRYLMDNLPHKDVFFPPSEAGIHQAEKGVALLLEIATKAKRKWTNESSDSSKLETSLAFDENTSLNIRQMASRIPEQYLPCHLVICGSDIGILLINENGEPHMVDSQIMGGRVFLGVSKLLTNGIQDYDELMRLASEGDCKSVDQFSTDSFTREAGDVYSMFLTDQDPQVFPFGKACYKDREAMSAADMVASFHNLTCETIARAALYNARLNKIHNLFFGGFFITHPRAREVITSFIYKKVVFSGLGEHNVQFLRHGGYLGAVGAFMQSP